MKKPKTPWLALLLFVLMLMSSANPTNSQKQAALAMPAPALDTVPPVKDSTRSGAVPVQSDRLDSVASKVEKVGKVFDQVDKKSVKMSRQLSSIQYRQARILRSLEPDPRVIIPISPKPAVLPSPNPEKPEIKPVEVERPNWWKRTFGHD